MKTLEPSRQISPALDTSDLNLASFLRCRGFKIQEIKRVNGKSHFVFQETPALHSAILDFANDGDVGVRSFCNTLRDMKAIAR